MKKSILCKALTLVLALVFILSLAACDKKDGNDKGNTETKKPAQTFTGDVIKAAVPSGWSFVTGTDMNGADIADFICHAEEFEFGDPYLQVTKDDRDISAIKELLESEETFGKYIGEVELNGTTWYIAENAASAMIGEKACFVSGYECDFSSEEVQSILGSIKWLA